MGLERTLSLVFFSATSIFPILPFPLQLHFRGRAAPRTFFNFISYLLNKKLARETYALGVGVGREIAEEEALQRVIRDAVSHARKL